MQGFVIGLQARMNVLLRLEHSDVAIECVVDTGFEGFLTLPRLKVQVENFDTGKGVGPWENAQVVCNQNIDFRSALFVDDETAVWFADVIEPLPASLSCEIRASR
jgi:hypothetical protein